MQKTGIGTRAVNCVVDTVIIALLAYAAFKAWNWQVIYWKYPYYNFGWFFFGILFIYYTIFESIFGRTPGKWLSFSKVVNQRGKKPGFLKVVIRSAVRITLIDLFFFPFLERTLHDYLSKTDVVEA